MKQNSVIAGTFSFILLDGDDILPLPSMRPN
jgi:hypothetical protein